MYILWSIYKHIFKVIHRFYNGFNLNNAQKLRFIFLPLKSYTFKEIYNIL